VVSGLVGFALDLGEPSAVGIERLPVGNGTWAARAICRVDHVEHVDVSTWVSE
jgi:hypothetical protein